MFSFLYSCILVYLCTNTYFHLFVSFLIFLSFCFWLNSGLPLFTGDPGLIPGWRRERLPTPAFWPGEFHGRVVHGSQRVGHDWATFTHQASLPKHMKPMIRFISSLGFPQSFFFFFFLPFGNAVPGPVLGTTNMDWIQTWPPRVGAVRGEPTGGLEQLWRPSHSLCLWKNLFCIPLCMRDCVLSRFSRVWLFVTPWTVAHKLPCPWDSPGKNRQQSCHCKDWGLKLVPATVTC